MQVSIFICPQWNSKFQIAIIHWSFFFDHEGAVMSYNFSKLFEKGFDNKKVYQKKTKKTFKNMKIKCKLRF